MTELTFEQLCETLGYTPRNRPLTSKEVSDFLGVHFATVEGWRVTGNGPRYFNPPGSRIVRYAERDILNWVAAGAKHSTSEAA